MYPRRKIPQEVRGWDRDQSKEGTKSAVNQKWWRRGCQQEERQNPICLSSRYDVLMHETDGVTDRKCEPGEQVKVFPSVQNRRAKQNACCQRMAEELREERKKNKILQEELEGFRSSLEAERHRLEGYEAGILVVQQLVDDFYRELDKEIKPHGDQASRKPPSVLNSTAQGDASRQKMAGDLQVEREKQERPHEQQQRVGDSCQEEVLSVGRQADDPQRQLDTETTESLTDQLFLQQLKAEQEAFSQKKVTEELQGERKSKGILQEELERVSASHHEDRQEHDEDMLITARPLAEDAQEELGELQLHGLQP
ncbi:Hypothetical protein SMAX5B_003038 [Scophthalmus maximus]|uniref:Uncharacterized protein n=1 Tax=Scophthalmus maximus TaxID=52904 RepID=A0A2U9CFA4_SCOMX|nr:uncharacterized protein LOC124849739 [Scophthalmus maximus]AWP14903.1 Hypothetical protein SMAX5B_003038 [Scophthalmus maximus]KAF0031257.1 hypothetical protein F2P81_015812 [Scophthalmus maximus]